MPGSEFMKMFGGLPPVTMLVRLTLAPVSCGMAISVQPMLFLAEPGLEHVECRHFAGRRPRVVDGEIGSRSGQAMKRSAAEPRRAGRSQSIEVLLQHRSSRPG